MFSVFLPQSKTQHDKNHKQNKQNQYYLRYCQMNGPLLSIVMILGVLFARHIRLLLWCWNRCRFQRLKRLFIRFLCDSCRCLRWLRCGTLRFCRCRRCCRLCRLVISSIPCRRRRHIPRHPSKVFAICLRPGMCIRINHRRCVLSVFPFMKTLLRKPITGYISCRHTQITK